MSYLVAGGGVAKTRRRSGEKNGDDLLAALPLTAKSQQNHQLRRLQMRRKNDILVAA